MFKCADCDYISDNMENMNMHQLSCLNENCSGDPVDKRKNIRSRREWSIPMTRCLISAYASHEHKFNNINWNQKQVNSFYYITLF